MEILSNYRFHDQNEGERTNKKESLKIVKNDFGSFLNTVKALQNDEQRLDFLKSLEKRSKKDLEEVGPAVIELASQTYGNEVKELLEENLLNFLNFKDSRLVRKTALFVLKQNYYKEEEFEPFFTLFASLEESQYHVIEPILPKFLDLVQLIESNKLSWEYLKTVFKKFINHTNGWIRCFGFKSLLDVPTKHFKHDVNFVVNDYYNSLNSYDPFWRLEETIGVKIFLDGLNNIVRDCLSSEFVNGMLLLFETRISPSPLLFMSVTLPDSGAVSTSLLDSSDIPQIRRVIKEISNVQYPNFKHDVIKNFMTFIFGLYDWDSDEKAMVSLLSCFTSSIRSVVSSGLHKYIHNDDVFRLFDDDVHNNGLIEYLCSLDADDCKRLVDSTDLIDVKLGVKARKLEVLSEERTSKLFVARLFELDKKIANEEAYIHNVLGPIVSDLNDCHTIDSLVKSNLNDNKSNLSAKGLLLLYSYLNLDDIPEVKLTTEDENLAFFHLVSKKPSSEVDHDDLVTKNWEIFSTDTEKAIKFLEGCCRMLNKLSTEVVHSLLEKCCVLAKETQKSSNFSVVCKYWIKVALVELPLDQKHAMEHLEAIMDIGAKNSQVAYMLSVDLLGVSLPNCLSNVLMRLAIYGDVFKKDDQVFFLANSMATRLDDKIFWYDKLPCMVRENAILSVFNKKTSESFFDALLLEVIEEIKIVDKTKGRSFGLSLGHRLKTRLMLLLLLLVKNSLESGHKQLIIDLCCDTLLDGSQQFSIRLPTEWIFTIYCLNSQKFFDEWLQKDIEFGEKRIGSVVSWMFVVLRCLKIKPQGIYNAILKVMRWITVTNFSVKCASAAVLKLLYKWHLEGIKEDNRLDFLESLVTFNPEISGNTQTVVDNLVDEPFFNQVQAGQTDLHTVFYKLMYLCGMPADEMIFEKKPEGGLPEDTVDFLTTWSEGKIQVSKVFSALVKSKVTAPEILMNPSLSDNVIDDFQLKIDPNETKFERNGKELVVVASLINKTANLGGLCRTCEVFGASALVLSNQLITSDQNFKALSMSAEKWLPIIEVKPQDLESFLQESKLKGFTVIAAEQTAASVPLHEFEFPDKTILLLGEEKKGVPPQLIKTVDRTVEIEQFGVTRSLNVHVSASLFIYQFAAQKYC
ncbi:unnamed protein product [Bursaphelenchus okinawaensis]|uniref:tRNA/rRNA methyltransferase SpoU type domain-containing protein n=1 Tax=Bursaphelenchus okinawaensis TaxID=465554 RepID=A0A811KW38_9BILA|nr:unnamed protein product [Bursaphelenchus okinawaensis]CAG9112744.1 unnamed protein product [Bursaphelenchus okinawaensis]